VNVQIQSFGQSSQQVKNKIAGQYYFYFFIINGFDQLFISLQKVFGQVF
jgi:hypothetical protein